MSAADLLGELRALGVHLERRGVDLHYFGPLGSVPRALRERIAAQRADVVEALRLATEPPSISPPPVCLAYAGTDEADEERAAIIEFDGGAETWAAEPRVVSASSPVQRVDAGVAIERRSPRPSRSVVDPCGCMSGEAAHAR